MRRTAITVVVILAGLAIGVYVFTQPSGESIDTSVSVAEAMGGGDTTGYRRATTVRDFTFPRDHGPHPGYKTEWWYLTGNLETSTGRMVGYQFTIFRVALTPPTDSSGPIQMASSAQQADTSDWATNQFYMGHFAVSDVQGEELHAAERFSRGAAGLAGAQAEPFRVWLEDWEIASTGDEPFPARLRATQEDAAIDLTVRPEKPHVLQGDRGLSQKGPGVGNASFYYSYTRMATEGTVVIQGDTLQVSGNSWMDREWSTSALGENQVGWDWFSLQLSDGRDLMYYQIRQQDGAPSEYTEGVLVAEDGTATPIDLSDVTLEVTDRWDSPRGGTYPVGWRLRIPSEELSLRITPHFNDQELDVSVRYWEGAVQVDGTADGTPITGQGYVEMTGYGDNQAAPVS
jgi:predicted secreted hydrolase